MLKVLIEIQSVGKLSAKTFIAHGKSFQENCLQTKILNILSKALNISKQNRINMRFKTRNTYSKNFAAADGVLASVSGPRKTLLGPNRKFLAQLSAKKDLEIKSNLIYFLC